MTHIYCLAFQGSFSYSLFSSTSLKTSLKTLTLFIVCVISSSIELQSLFEQPVATEPISRQWQSHTTFHESIDAPKTSRLEIRTDKEAERLLLVPFCKTIKAIAPAYQSSKTLLVHPLFRSKNARIDQRTTIEKDHASPRHPSHYHRTIKMKVYSSSTTFNYTWNEVTTALWRKYCPWNDQSTHVVAVDTLSRNVDPETGILRTERLITCRQSPPAWLNGLIKSLSNSQDPGISYNYEASYVDAKGKTVTMVSQNLTWSNLLSCQEEVVYRPAEPSKTDGGERTVFEQSARITALCGGWQRIRNGIEDSCLSRFGENAEKGRDGFERVLAMSRKIWDEERERREKEEMDLTTRL